MTILKPESTPTQTQVDTNTILLSIRKSTLKPVLRLFSIAALIGAIGTIPGNLYSGYWFIILLSILAFGWLLVSTFVKSIPYLFQTIGLLVILYGYAVYGLVSVTPLMDGRILLAGFIITAFIFEGVRFGIYAGILSTITVLVYGGITYVTQFAGSPAAGSSGLAGFISTSLFFTLAAIFITALMAFFTRILEKELTTDAQSRANLSLKVNELNSSLQKVTNDYKRSEGVIDSIDQFIKQFSVDTSPGSTLQKSITTLKNQFGYYFVGAFEKEEKGGFAILRAGTGQEGETLLSRNFRIKLSDAGLISHAFNHGEIRLSPNIREDLNFLQNPLLPSTLSELALPLIYEGKVLGVIDIQSDKINAFSPEELRILRALVDQISISYQKALISQQLNKLQVEAENNYQQFTQKSWRSHLRQTKQKFSYRYIENVIEKEAPQSIGVVKAINQGKSVTVHSQAVSETGERSTSLAVPIKLRGQTIGALDIKIGAGQMPSDLETLIETICNRLALALENARLIEEMQNKATREHQVSEISNKIRSSPNVDQVLRIAVAEIGQTLGASEVLIHLHSNQ